MAAPYKLALQGVETIRRTPNSASADTLQVCEPKRAPLSGTAPNGANAGGRGGGSGGGRGGGSGGGGDGGSADI